MNKLNRRALRSSLLGIIAMAALLFIPAGTCDYWQAWLFMAVFVGASAAITVYLAIKDPELLERRMRVGPAAEKEPAQKILMSFAMAGFVGLLVFPQSIIASDGLQCRPLYPWWEMRSSHWDFCWSSSC
ncbi:MAG: hypothetical protein V4634_03285 [Pseudomonadota bacterium]